MNPAGATVIPSLSLNFIFGSLDSTTVFGHLQAKDMFPKKEVNKKIHVYIFHAFPFPALTDSSLGQCQSIYWASLNSAFIKGRKNNLPSTLLLLRFPWSAVHVADKLAF